MKLIKPILLSLIIFALGLSIYFYPLITTSILTILFCLYLIIKRTYLGVALFLFSIPALNKMLILIFKTAIPQFYFIAFFIGVFVYLFYSLAYGNGFSYKLGAFDYSLIVFFAYCLFSSVFISINKIYGFEKLLFLFLSIVMAYTLFFINYKSSLETITSALVIFGIIISIFSVYDLLGIKSTLFQYTFLGRFSFLDLNPIYLARYISAAILGNLFWIIKLFKAKEKSSLAALLLVLVSLFELYILLLTASRGPILALLVACAAYTIIVGKFRIIKLLCAAAIVLLVVIFSTIIIPEAFLERILSVNPSGQITIVSRYLGNLAAIKNFWANKIFGIGFGSFIFKFGDIETMIYPHNIFTEIMAEGGFIGILLLLEIIVLTVFKYLINIKTSLNKHGFLVAFLLAAIINANLSGHIGKNFYFWVGLALIYAEYSRGKKIDEKNSDSNI